MIFYILSLFRTILLRYISEEFIRKNICLKAIGVALQSPKNLMQKEIVAKIFQIHHQSGRMFQRTKHETNATLFRQNSAPRVVGWSKFSSPSENFQNRQKKKN